MVWNLLLYGCFHTAGREYGFDVLAGDDLRLGRALRSAGMGCPAWFYGYSGGRAFFGRRNYVGPVLGWDHPVAKDASRPLEFMLAYTGASRNELPSWEELGRLEARIARDLERYGDMCLNLRAPLERDVPIALPPFDGPRSRGGGTAWDCGLAGRRPGAVALFVADDNGCGDYLTHGAEKEAYRLPREVEPRRTDDWMEDLIAEKRARRRRFPFGCMVVGVASVTAVGAAIVRPGASDPGGAGQARIDTIAAPDG